MGLICDVGRIISIMLAVYGAFIETLGLCLLLLFGSDNEQYIRELKEMWCNEEYEPSPGMLYVDVMV